MLPDFCVIIKTTFSSLLCLGKCCRIFASSSKRHFHHSCVRVNAAGFLRHHQKEIYSQCLPLFATRKKEKVKNNSKCYHPSINKFLHSCVRLNAAGFLCHHQKEFSSLLC